jgi:tetratricopeptide (TPR) repeat protein
MESKSDNFSANLNKLVRFFERTDGGYAFASTRVQANIQVVNSKLIRLLEEKAKKTGVVYFDSESSMSLLEQLKQKMKENVSALVVNNFTELLFSFSKNNDSVGKDALLELNFSRENLYELKIPILFWLTDDFVSVFSNRAADLYSQRSINTVYFDNIPDEDVSTWELETSFQPKHRSSKNNQDAGLKIELLKKQLRDAEKGKYHLSDITNRLVMPLAKIYSKLDLHSKSLNLINKYKDYINRKNLQILMTLAKILKKANMLEEAISQYEEAITLAKLESNLKDEALCKFYIASIYMEKGQPDDALQYFIEYNDLFRQLFDKNPDNENIKTSLAISYSKLGDVYQELGKHDEALHFFEQECELFSQLHVANPKSTNVKNGLAISYSKIGSAYQNIGEYNKAIHYIEMDLKLTKELNEADKSNRNVKNALSVSYERLGDIYQALGQYEKALQFFRFREQIAKELYEVEPENNLFLEGFAISKYKLATTLKNLNNSESKKYFNEWENLLKALNQDFPDSSKYKSWKSLNY